MTNIGAEFNQTQDVQDMNRIEIQEQEQEEGIFWN